MANSKLRRQERGETYDMAGAGVYFPALQKAE